MRIKLGDTSQKVALVAVDATDGFTRETGITGWTVYYSLNGGTATAMTTPTVAQLDATNMPGDYVLTIDESGMTSAKGELIIHASATGVAHISRSVEITENFEADNYARIGAPAGASIAADLLVIDNFVDGIETTIGAAGAGLTAVSLAATGLDAVPYSATGAVALARAVWTDTLTTYTNGMAGKRLKGITAVPTIDGTINDAAATTTSFITSLTGYGANFFDDALCLIEYATDKWQANPVATYTSATGAMTFVEAFYAAPANGLNITLLMTHVHPVSQIQAGLATQTSVNDLPTNAELATALGTADDAVLAQVALVKAKTDNLTFTVAGQVDSNMLAITGDTGSATKLERVLSGNTTGTVGAGSTTTSIVTSSMNPAASVTDQYKGLILKFDDATTTAALRGQGTDITASTAAGVLTCTALTTAPVSGDVFTVS